MKLFKFIQLHALWFFLALFPPCLGHAAPAALPRQKGKISQKFELTRAQLIQDVRTLMTPADKSFLVSFEQGNPDWNNFEFIHFRDYPSVQWKLMNLQKLGRQNRTKLAAEAEKLSAIFTCA